MEYVEPITNIHKIKEIKAILKKKSTRDFALFTLGINTGLRISHILNIKLSDITDSSGNIVEVFLPFSNKNSNYSYIYINTQVRKSLKLFLSENKLEQNDFLFKSSKGNLPISRQQAYRIINSAAREVGIDTKIGTHTLRKTFGYHAYRQGVAISLLQQIFQHTTKAETYDYLGIDPLDRELIKIDVNL